MKPILNPGSFRDPRGQIYHLDQRILRSVLTAARDDFEFVQASGLIEKLIAQQKLLPQTLVDKSILAEQAPETCYVLEHPRLDFISYPYEWPFTALKAAALLHLDVQLIALEHGVTLTDASAYNVQFQGAQPIFIDHLAFCRYIPGSLWNGYRQFCEQFINPLLLQAYLGISYQAWYRGNLQGIATADINRLISWRHKFLPQVFINIVLPSYFQKFSNREAAQVAKQTQLPLQSLKNLLEGLKSWVEKLTPHKKLATVWQHYAEDHGDVTTKKAFIKDFVTTVRPTLMFDLGCNNGEYAELALAAGAKHVIGFDSDLGALDLGFNTAVAKRYNFLPLHINLANQSPNQGWNEAERAGLTKRACADAVIALALAHHLAIAENIPFRALVHWIIDFAPQGVIEFVPKTDPKVQELLQLRPDIFADYSYEDFLHYIKQKAQVVKECKVSDTNRILVWYQQHAKIISS